MNKIEERSGSMVKCFDIESLVIIDTEMLKTGYNNWASLSHRQVGLYQNR